MQSCLSGVDSSAFLLIFMVHCVSALLSFPHFDLPFHLSTRSSRDLWALHNCEGNKHEYICCLCTTLLQLYLFLLDLICSLFSLHNWCVIQALGSFNAARGFGACGKPWIPGSLISFFSLWGSELSLFLSCLLMRLLCLCSVEPSSLVVPGIDGSKMNRLGDGVYGCGDENEDPLDTIIHFSEYLNYRL